MLAEPVMVKEKKKKRRGRQEKPFGHSVVFFFPSHHPFSLFLLFSVVKYLIVLPPDPVAHSTMKEFSATQYFNYPWEYVSAANWRKYPNEVSTHVVAVDVLRREFDPEKQTLKSERLITCKQPIPKWLKAFVGGADTSYVREVSVVDRLGQTLTLRSVNLTMARLLKVYETVTYSPDPRDPLHSTKFEQVAQFKSSAGWKRVESQVEAWAVERFSQNASKGKLGFDSILKLGILENNFTVKLNELSNSAASLVDEINVRTSDVLEDINEKTDKIMSEIDANTTKLLAEIKGCHVFKDINDISLDILKEMSVQTGNALSELNKTSTKVIGEVNEMSDEFLQNVIKDVNDKSSDILDHVQNKTSLILKEFDDKQKEVTEHVGRETKVIFDALNKKTVELLQDVAPSPIHDVSDKSIITPSISGKIAHLLSRITHPFSKSD